MGLFLIQEINERKLWTFNSYITVYYMIFYFICFFISNDTNPYRTGWNHKMILTYFTAWDAHVCYINYV